MKIVMPNHFHCKIPGVGCLPDFINSEVGVLVPLEDPVSLAEAIIDEITNGH